MSPALGAVNRTIQLSPLSVRAAISSVNEDDRTVELVFTTGAPVERMDWMSGKQYIERLSLEPEHIMIDRLNEGGPLLDSHSAWSVTDQLGAVVPGSVRLSRGEARATVRFSRREQVDPIFRDVADGIIRSVSVGYKTYRYEETPGKGNALPVRLAVRWEPFEISMVPIPADAGAKVREGKSADANTCEIVPAGGMVSFAATRAEEVLPVAVAPTKKESKPMEREDRSESIAEQPPQRPVEQTAPQPVEPNERDAGIAAERLRCQGINSGCRSARLLQSFADKLIADGVPLVDAQSQILLELGKREGQNLAPRQGGPVLGDDPLIHLRKGIENALLHRLAPKYNKLEDFGRAYRGMTFLDIGRTYLNGQGVRTTGLSKMELAGLALGLQARAGMHTISDFALLVADVTAKTLRQAYDEAPQTFEPITRRVTLPDFKLAKRLQVGEAPALLEVLEHGEFTHGTVGESKEQFQLKTYGRIFAITRQALVNDDTDAFSRMAISFGRAAKRLESDLVWAQITSNPNMSDGTALFIAGHGNLAGSAAVIDVTSLSIARAAMRNQTGLEGTSRLNLTPKYLIVPPSKETVAQQYVGVVTPALASSVNPFSGTLQVIAEPRLEAASGTAWYLAADPGQIDIMEAGSLEGEGGPMVESRIGFDIDGLEIKARHDFAAKVIDWRGLFKNAGA